MNIRRFKKRYFIALIVVLIVLVGVIIYISRGEPKVVENNNVTTTTVQPLAKTSDPPVGEPVTITGTVICLKTKSTTEQQAQIANCAIGLKQDDGKSYALSSQDPYITGSLPSGQRVEVNGLLSHQPSDYDIVGRINITSIKL